MGDRQIFYRTDVSKVTGETGWTLRMLFFRVCIPVIIFAAVLAVIGHGLGWFGEAGEVAQREFGAGAAVYKYEWFKDKSNSLVAAEERIKITDQALTDFKESAGEREKWTFEDKDEYSRLTTDLRGQKAHFEQLKAEYRAACLTVNRAVFKGDDKIIRWADELTVVDEAK